MLALGQVEKETNSLGIPIDVAMDPANQFKFVTRRPRTDWAEHTLAADVKAFYEANDTDKDHPINRAGHKWSVYLDETQK